MADGFLSVMTSIGDAEAARAMARALVEARLVACAQIVPIESVYRWEGKVEEAREVLLLCKARARDYEAVEVAIRERHPYDVPEIVAVPIIAGARPYLDWILASTEPVDAPKPDART